MKYPLASTSWDEAEYQAIAQVVERGRFTMGEKVQEFERDLAEYFGSRYCIMVNSGSSANLLVVAALFYTKSPLQAGDEVIVPAVSWSTTFFPLSQYGLHLKFVDIDVDTLNYDLEQLASAITSRTRAIVVVNLLGNPNDFERVQALIGDRSIVLLEDNCEAMGARYKGRYTGTIGRMGTLSSFFSHHISTMEGGAVLTDDEELYHVMLCVRAHGWTRNLPESNHVCAKSVDPFYESFRFVLPGYNLRPLEMSGAIGIQQLKKLPLFIEERRRNAARFVEMFAHHPKLRIQREIGESSWFGFSFVLRPECERSRAEIVGHLSAHGIECRPVVTGNFTRNDAIRYVPHEVHGELRNADQIHDRGFFVGNHHYDLSQELEYLAKTLQEIL